MAQAFLSEVELYYSGNAAVDNKISIEGDECHHLTNVMRHKVDDILYVADGRGSIHKSVISGVEKNKVTVTVKETIKFENGFSNIWFCIPRLKNPDRFEFAIEKSVEPGITNFIVFDSKRTVAKGAKIERWEKILMAAMKQSLRAWLPQIQYVKSVNEIMKLEGTKVLFDQNAEETFRNSLLTNQQTPATNRYFIFGPEGGFDNSELKMESLELIRLTENRLRSETAVVTAAAILASNVL